MLCFRGTGKIYMPGGGTGSEDSVDSEMLKVWVFGGETESEDSVDLEMLKIGFSEGSRERRFCRFGDAEKSGFWRENRKRRFWSSYTADCICVRKRVPKRFRQESKEMLFSEFYLLWQKMKDKGFSGQSPFFTACCLITRTSMRAERIRSYDRRVKGQTF